MLHADTPIPDGCTSIGVALAALFLLKKLPRPLICKKTAQKLTTAAQESLLRPHHQEVAIYVARCAVQELKPSTTASPSSGGTSSKYNIFMLLKGIIRTLREVADNEHVRYCLPRFETIGDPLWIALKQLLFAPVCDMPSEAVNLESSSICIKTCSGPTVVMII